MHDIWNPWHGCLKISEGCQNCYMFTMDKRYDNDGSHIYKTKTSFNYPLAKDRYGNYKIKSGELIRLCMSSDFFLEEADKWRDEVWKIIKIRSDVKFYILTKRAHRIQKCLPQDWGNGYENVILNVTCENQKRADERIPILLNVPAKHKGIMCAPFIGEIHIDTYLQSKQIEQVICGGENYDGQRPCHYQWIKDLSKQCQKYNISFTFIETGTYFVKDNKRYHIPNKLKQSQLAYKSRLSFKGKPIDFVLKKNNGNLLKENIYIPHYRKNCLTCGSRPICNGCSDCGKCNEPIIDNEVISHFDKRHDIYNK